MNFERHAFVCGKLVVQKEKKQQQQQQNPIPSESEELPWQGDGLHLGLEGSVWVINAFKTLKTLDLVTAFC